MYALYERIVELRDVLAGRRRDVEELLGGRFDRASALYQRFRDHAAMMAQEQAVFARSQSRCIGERCSIRAAGHGWRARMAAVVVSDSTLLDGDEETE